MQISTLNKAISYTIVGLLAVLALLSLSSFYLGWELLEAVLQSIGQRDYGALLAGAIASLILPVALFLGIINEGLSRVMIRQRLEKHAFLTRWNKLLSVQKDFQEFRFARKRFRREIHAAVGEKAKTTYPHPSLTAEALFFEKASEAIIKYTTTHYASYILTSNLLFLLLGYDALFLFCGLVRKQLPLEFGLFLLVFSLVASYALLSLSARLYLYTHSTLYNHAIFFVAELPAGPRCAARSLDPAGSRPQA